MTTAIIALYQSAQIRLCEQMAIRDLGLSEEELMARAGYTAFSILAKSYPAVRAITVFCGAGNNAGDGYVVARLAWQKGYAVTIHQYKEIENLPLTAQHAALAAIAAGVPVQCLEDPIDSETELIVDALLGIGIKGEVYGPIAAAINQINDSGLPVLALDVPSGLDADTGAVMGHCINAATTVTFIGRKLGLFTLDGPDFCGEVICNSLQLDNCLSTIKPIALLLGSELNALLSLRKKNSHKGNYGHVLIVGGNFGMPGSVSLAAFAALRVGAGVVTIATRPEYAYSLAMLPEVMIYGIKEASELTPLIAKATVCIIGPGLGEDKWACDLFAKALASQLPMVIDASALRLLAKNPQYDDNWILTPHPGEAACLLGESVTAQDIQQDRYQAIVNLQNQYGGNIVLKGNGSLVATPEAEVYLCENGNPGMASAGMGDALSGILAGLYAQGLTLADAAKLGVWLHASAGDAAAAKYGERGLIASDLINHLPSLVNPGSSNE